ncbi:MAG: RNA polymerase sigma factor [Phycisphaerae bacterium]
MSSEKPPAMSPENVVSIITPHIGWLRSKIAPRIPARFRAHLDIDDVIQLVWKAVIYAHKEFELRGEPALRGWLLQIAKNELADEISKLTTIKRGGQYTTLRTADGNSNFAARLLAEICGPDATASWESRRREKFELVERAVNALFADARQCVMLRFAEGLTYPEIAKRLNTTETAVRSLLYRALGEIREKFDSAQ